MSSKRVFDIALIIASAPLLVPLLVGVAIAVRVKLGAPVFFTQDRPGLHGKPFRLVKFRSMFDERDDNGALLPDADRLPAFGRFLRVSSLDELPEIFNILAGEMSFVGPRPLLMEYLPLYTTEQARRHDVPPGITGWAQVNGRNALSWEAKFAHDVWYVDHRSAWLDVKILARTVGAVLGRRGISAGDHATMPRFEGSASGGDATHASTEGHGSGQSSGDGL